MPATTKRLNHLVDQRLWAAVLDAFRLTPGNYSRAAAKARCTPRTARKLWNEGYPGRDWGQRPMKEILMDERRAADARAAAAQALAAGPDAAEVAKGRELAIETRADEARMLRFARGNVQGFLNATTELTATAMRLAQRVSKTIEADEAKLDAKDRMTLFQALLTLSRMAGIIQKGIYAAESCVALERMVLGDPKERGAAPGATGEALTTEEALESIDSAVQLAARMEARGLRIINGGRGGDVPLASVEAPAAPPPGQGSEVPAAQPAEDEATEPATDPEPEPE